MKTTHLIIGIILVMILGLFATAAKEGPTLKTPLSEVVIEEPLVVEEWMFKPFVRN